MKKIFAFLTMMLLSLTTLFAQVSNDKISYQAVVRNSQNQLVVNQEVGVTITVNNGSTAVYTEEHTVTTNVNGLMSLLIGEGTVTSGAWENIDWSNASVTTEVTIDGETITHTVPVNAVPFALYADQVNPENVIYAISDTLAYYTTSDEIDTLLGDYVTNEALEDTLANYTTSDQIDTLLGDYVTNDAMDDALETLESGLQETLANYATDEELEQASTDLIQAIHDTADVLRSEMPDAQVQADWEETDQDSKAFILNKPAIVTPEELSNALEEISGALEELQEGLEETLDDYATKQALADTAANIRNAIPAQEQADWAETDNQAKSFIKNKPEIVTPSDLSDALEELQEGLEETLEDYATKQALADTAASIRSAIPAAANAGTVTLWQGTPNNPLGYFDVNTSDNVSIEIPTTDSKITTAKINEFLDNVDIDTAMTVLPHVQGMPSNVKEGLKTWVALVAKNNPTYVMDILTHYIENLTPAQVNEIFGAYDDMNAQAKSDFRDNLLEILDIPAPEAQVQADWTETNTDSKAFIQNKPTIPEAANNATLTITQGPNNTLGTFTANSAEDVTIDIPVADTKITTAKINEFIDHVTMDTAMAVFPHVQGMDNDVKTGLKTWVAQVVKNNPTYAMDVLTYYIENLTQSQVGEIFGAYEGMNADAKADLLNGLAQIIKDNPDIAYDVLIHYIDNVTVQDALPVYQHIHNNMNADVKEGLKLFVAQTVKNNPSYVMDVLTHYIENLTQAQVSEIFGAYDNMNADAKSDFRENLLEILDIPVADTKITTAKINEFIENVTMDTAMAVFPYVQGMDNDVKTGLKTWVAQVVKNNPTYAMDVLTHYIENLTQAQVSEIFSAYGDMNADAKEDLLNGLAQIIKDNPDIAYDVLIHYIDNVTVQDALPVYQHIHNNMNADVKEGLKLFVAQTAKNNPTYVYDVLDYYLGNTTASTSVGEAITKYAANHKDVAKAIVANYLQNGTAQDVDDMVSALLQNNAGGKEQFKNYLNAYIDSRIPAAATETSQKFSATDGQNSFTLNQTPKTNYVVRLYINGVMVGDSATGVVTVNGTTVTYVPAQNDNYNLKAGDKVILSFFY